MSLNYVTVTFTEQDAANDAGSGSVSIAPTSVVTAAGVTVVSQTPVVRNMSAGSLSVMLVACDNTGTSPAAGFWAYSITLPGGTPQTYLVNFANGSTQRFDNLTPAVASTTYGPAASSGGFTNPMTTLGDIMYENATPAAARLAGSTSATKQFLTQTGTGTVSAAPAWGTIAAGDVPTLNQNTTGTAANVTGTVAIGNGGTGQTTQQAAIDALAGSHTSGQYLRGNGTHVQMSAIQAADLPYQPWQFYVGAYGAKGDGVTDDTAAVNSALAAAYAYAVANNGYYELVFGPYTYLIAGATSTGTLGVTGQCKAQIPLHITATTAQKVTGVWRGTRDASALYHWQQTTVQQSGTVLKTTLNASAQFSVTGTEPSVVGGGVPANGYGSSGSLFGNDLIVIDGITIQTPNDPKICGWDFRGVAEANVISASALVNAGGGLIGSITAPTQAWQFGLAMPETNNNDNCNVQMWSAEGQNYGLVASEHTIIWSMRGVYCIAALVASGEGSSTPHAMMVHYLSAEACQIGVQFNYNSASPCKINIFMLDYEAASGSFANFNVINDPNNYGVGDITVANISAATPRTATMTSGNAVLNGGSGLRVWSSDLARGHITAPSVPGSTTALLNGSGANAAVTIATGAGVTVSVIAVDGTATGATLAASSSTTVTVPANKNITLTYAGGTPSWVWNLF